MSAINKLSKEVLNISLFSKDTVKNNVTNSALKGELSLNQDQLKHLLSLIENSIDQATQKGLAVFEKNLKNTLETEFLERKSLPAPGALGKPVVSAPGIRK